MKKLIVVTGPDGSGKSTLLSQLSTAYPQFTLASIWDALKLLDNTTKQDIQHQLKNMTTQARTLFLSQALNESLKIALTKNLPILFDSYGYKYYITQKIMGDDENAKLLLELPPPDLVFYLDCQPETALKRKKQQGLSDYESGFNSDKEKEFLNLQHQSKKAWTELIETQSQWIKISDDLPLNEKFDLISSHLKQIL